MRRRAPSDCSFPYAWFLFTGQPTWPMHVGGIAIVDPSHGWSFNAMRDLLAERLPLIPEFTMKIKEAPFRLDRPLLAGLMELMWTSHQFARRQRNIVWTARRTGGRTGFDQAPDVPFNGVLGPLRHCQVRHHGGDLI